MRSQLAHALDRAVEPIVSEAPKAAAPTPVVAAPNPEPVPTVVSSDENVPGTTDVFAEFQGDENKIVFWASRTSYPNGIREEASTIDTVTKNYDIIDTDIVNNYTVIYDNGNKLFVPLNESNRHYKEVLQWVAEGNEIGEPE